VRDISLGVKRGQLVAVIGNNGAGKSSMVRGATGWCGLPAARCISAARIPRPSAPTAGRARPGDGAGGRLLFPDQTVEDNLILGAYLHGGLKSQASRAALQKVLELFPRLRERMQQQAGSLSGGEQQMLAIARA